jgi:mRNA interferase RelE/StbE
MDYTIELTSRALKDLSRLAKAVRVRIGNRVDALANDSRPRGSIKLSGSDDLFRIRVGDYRVIYSVDDEERIITIARVKHRRHVYRS